MITESDVMEAYYRQMNSTDYDAGVIIHPLDALREKLVKRYPRKYKKQLVKNSLLE